MGNKKQLKEDLDRFNSIISYGKKLNEDRFDSVDAHHSEDPAQVNMFTQLAGEDRSQIIFQFASDNNIYSRLEDMINVVDGLKTEWWDMMEAFENTMKEKEKFIESDTNISQLWRDLESLGGQLEWVDDGISRVINGIDEVVTHKGSVDTDDVVEQ